MSINMGEDNTMDYNQLLEAYNTNYNDLLLMSLKITNDRQGSEDVIANVMLRIWERKDTLTIDNYGGYLRNTVRNRSLNYKRDKKVKREVNLVDWDIIKAKGKHK